MINISKTSFDDLVQQKTRELAKEKKADRDDFVLQIQKEIVPKVGGTIKGKVIEMAKNAIHLDLGSFGLGVVRGEELWESIDAYADIKVGDVVEVTILELENELGEMELSFRKLTKVQAWAELNKKGQAGEAMTIKIQGANKGGLLSTIFGIPAFMPVSQLAPEHYPRVEGGDVGRILSKLQGFIGKKMQVKILTADPREEKLIISEKAAVLDQQRKRLALLEVGDVVEGTISGVVGFGAFMKFPSPRKKEEEFEGLIHISELAWEKISDPSLVVKVGSKVKAEIIGIDSSKITLSLKRLKKDPWQEAAKKYKVGQKVKGKVVKLESFGAFVSLDKTIRGLAHLSELDSKKVKSPAEILKLNKEYEFKILSIEPEEHRLGLSLRALKEEPKAKEKPKTKEETKTKKTVKEKK